MTPCRLNFNFPFLWKYESDQSWGWAALPCWRRELARFQQGRRSESDCVWKRSFYMLWMLYFENLVVERRVVGVDGGRGHPPLCAVDRLWELSQVLSQHPLGEKYNNRERSPTIEKEIQQLRKIYPKYFVEADAVGKVGILLGKEIGVLLLEGGVVHDVLRVADHVGDLIRLDKQTNNNLILKTLMAEGTTRRFTFSSAFLLVALSIQSASSRPFLKQMHDKTQCLLLAGQNDWVMLEQACSWPLRRQSFATRMLFEENSTWKPSWRAWSSSQPPVLFSRRKSRWQTSLRGQSQVHCPHQLHKFSTFDQIPNENSIIPIERVESK